MLITRTALHAQAKRLSPPARIAIAAAARPCAHVDVALLKALMSRETNMQNIVGDGGHGRGGWQLDDRFREHELRTMRGCRSGSSIPVFPSAFPKGRVPTISAGAKFAARTIEANIAECKRRGVKDGHRLSVAISGYNAGITGAIDAYMRHGKTPSAADTATTGGNYAADVLERARALR